LNGKARTQNGHTQIANETLEQLAKLYLSPNQWQVVIFIIRKTYGFHKKVDYIANSQIVEGTGLGKTVISRTLRNLEQMKVISRDGKYLGFQKDWQKWQRLAEQPTPERKEVPKTVGRKNTRASESYKVATWRAKVFHRDGLTCRICGRHGDILIPVDIFLHGHHILSWEEYPELRFNVDNGLTMCDDCHYCYHYGRSDNTYEYIKEVFDFKKLAVQLTSEKLAMLHEKLAEQLKKVSSPRVTQKIKDTIQNKVYIYIFDVWNELRIIVHKKCTPDMKRTIENALTDYSQEELEQSIRNYAEIVKGPEYYFDHKWTLVEFLSRRNNNNIERFLDLEVAKSNFKKEAGRGTHRQDPTKLPPRDGYTRPDG